jgi:hypothetical protein
MKRFALVILFTLLAHTMWAASVRLSFSPVFGGETLMPGKTYYHAATHDSIRIDVCRFYVSAIKFMLDERVVFDAGAAVYLIDAGDSATQQIFVTLPDSVRWNTVFFCLGTDSITNTAGALGGSLDPANSMYWAWQSGYINLKLEGRAAKCTTRKKLFQYHLGGYLYPYNTLQPIQLNCAQRQVVTLLFEADRFFEMADVTETPEVMSPCVWGVELSRAAAGLFRIKP